MKELRGKVNTVITSTLSLSLSVRATPLCVTLSVSVSTWAFFACRAPLSIRSPSFLPLSLFFPTPPLPEAEIPHRSHSNVRLSHGAPFLILTQHQSETPHTHQTHSYASLRAEGWESTYCTTGAMKRHVWILGVMWEGTRRDCRQPVSTKSIIILITRDTQGAMQVLAEKT